MRNQIIHTFFYNGYYIELLLNRKDQECYDFCIMLGNTIINHPDLFGYNTSKDAEEAAKEYINRKFEV